MRIGVRGELVVSGVVLVIPGRAGGVGLQLVLRVDQYKRVFRAHGQLARIFLFLPLHGTCSAIQLHSTADLAKCPGQDSEDGK